MPAMSILIIDDEEDFVDMVKMRLEAMGCKVAVAYDGEQGLAKINSQKIDVVFLDVVLPDIDGMDILKAIKKDKSAPQVFMMTAYSTDARAKQARLLGADGYFSKDVDIKKEVEEAIGKAIKIKKGN